MKKISWNESQLECINHQGGNLLISAGAGSGKTAVLTARVIRHLKNNIKLENLLLLTFTNAAASEMKQRIEKEILKDENILHLVSDITKSNIMTFDAFALNLVKKYHYLLNLNKNINILDQNYFTYKKSEIIDQIFSEYYLKKDNEFNLLIKSFVDLDDKILKEIIVKISNQIELNVDIKSHLEYLHDDKKMSQIFKEDFDNLTSQIDLLHLQIRNIYEDASRVLSIKEDLKYFEEAYKNYVLPIVNTNDYKELTTLVNEFPTQKFGRKKLGIALFNLTNELKETIKKIKEKLIYDNHEIITPLYKINLVLKNKVIEILVNLFERLEKIKFEKQIFNHMDIAKLAIKLVDENESIKDELKNKFYEILIDEYQDTNDIQEYFLTKISDNNLYFVGDIKQSIYRFRNANPKIFNQKYNQYEKGINGKKIDLNQNYRSSKEVIDFINLLFSSIMNNDNSDIDYLNKHQLIFGNNNYLLNQSLSQNRDPQIINYIKKDYKYYNEAEIEAFIIASDIKEKINSNFKVFDNKINEYRNIKYDDFAILIDVTNHFEIFEKIFSYFNIPLGVFKNYNIIELHETILIKNLLILLLKIENKVFDEEYMISFLSVLRSFLYQTSDDEIYEIVTSNSFNQTTIYKSILNIISQKTFLTNYELLTFLYKEFDIFYLLKNLNQSNLAKNRLIDLLDLAKSFDESNLDLNEFINYLSGLDKYDLKLEVPIRIPENAVKIMTIHKSKGLEFPVCYFPLLNHKFKTEGDKIIYDPNKGIILPFNEPVNIENFQKHFVIETEKKEEVSEKLRLFYVALTRSKEKIILINQISESSKEDSFTSFKDFLLSGPKDIFNYQYFIDPNKLYLTKDYLLTRKEGDLIKDNSNHISYKEITKKLTTNNTIKKPIKINLIDKTQQEVINKGDYLHYIVSLIDLKNPNLNELNLDKDKSKIINDFLNSNLLDNKNIISYYQEHEFYFQENNEEKHGYIDLIVEYSDHFKIIDFKFFDLNKEEYLNQLNFYYQYLKSKVNKPIKLYLYSFRKREYKIVEINN